jgi:type I site-specific restriction endonuclease
MSLGQSNFDFLQSHSPQLAKLGALAERYFHGDPPGALGKLRLLGEFLAKEIAAQHALLPSGQPSFDDVLRALKAHGVLPHDVADFFYHLKRAGNAALHENVGSAGEALHGLKIARALSVWYHKSYAGNPGFKAGPFVPPVPPLDATGQLRDEIEELKRAVRQSSDAAAKARLAAQIAEEEKADLVASVEAEAEQRAFWEQYASETEDSLRAATKELAETQAKAVSAPPHQLDLLARLGAEQAQQIEIDEATTRVLIDDQLRTSGWEVDSVVLRHSAGARPAYGKAMAIAEWPTATGPVDYALFIDGRCVGVIEAKRQFKDVPGRIGQAKRYAIGIELTPDELPRGGPWTNGDDRFRVPFLFVTNGRPYVKQLATKSGTWFWDARSGSPPRALVDWFSPRDLVEKLDQQLDEDLNKTSEREIGVTGLRPYQQEAVDAVRDAVGRGQNHILLAMATGTGKTRLAIALMYDLLRAKRFRRILFLVDRNALGRQTLDAMATTDTNGFLKFDEVFPVADLATKFPEATDRVQVATVQAMVRRVFDDPDAERPTPGTYDLIIVDEAHRGYGPQPHDLVEKITGSVDKPLDRIKAFKNDPRPKYVVTVDLLTTGIDVPAITNLVFVRRVNSRILYDQMIGRATRRCDEIGKEYFRIFDAVDIYANLQEVTDMRPVVVDPGLTFGKLVADLENAPSAEDKQFVRDQIVVKLRQRLRLVQGERREALESVIGPLADLPDRLKDAPPEETAALFRQHPELARVLDLPLEKGRRDTGIFISEHEDELIDIADDFGNKASPADYIESFETFVRANMNAVPAMIAATQRPRELTRKELKELALLLDQQGYSEANLRRAYGSTRNADIAAHIIGFVRQAALGDPLVPYETRVENGVQAMLNSRPWSAKQRQWLTRIGRALKAQPVSDPELLGDGAFAQAGGFEAVDREFDHGLGELLKDLNAAIWDGGRAA